MANYRHVRLDQGEDLVDALCETLDAAARRAGHATAPASDRLEAALALETLGYWAIPIHPPAITLRSGDRIRTTTGKEPIGAAWGAERRDRDWLRRAFHRNPGAGVGICVGPGRAPGGGWLIDLEGDGPEAADSLLSLLEGEIPATPGWDSRRGAHTLFRVEGDRLLDLLQRAGADEGKGSQAGVFRLSELPGLEWRIGGSKADGTTKQLQSVCPPTAGEDGIPRAWRTPPDVPVAWLAETAYQALAAIAKKTQDAARNESMWWRTAAGGPTIEDRAIAYLARCDPAISGQRGHDRTLSAACKIGPGFNLDPAIALRLLLDHYNPRCEPPWSEAELRHKVDDSYRVETRRGWLADTPRRGHDGAVGNGHYGGGPASNGKAIDLGGLSDADLGIVSASEIQAQRIQWLWQYRLARGEMALMVGEGGLGKSQLLLATAAIISRGDEFPDRSGRAPVGRTVILSAEDCPETTIIPRLIALGADLDKITIVRAQLIIRKSGQEPVISPMSLQNLDYWRAVFNRLPDTILFIVDPLPSYLGRGINDAKNAEIRGVLEPFLGGVIRPRKICVFANTHLNKSAEIKTPVHRITGSIAYGNIPRNVHLVVRDPERPDRRYFKQCKCNNAPEELPALAFEVARRTIQGVDGEIEAAIPVFERETVSVDLRALICGDAKRRGPQPVKLDELVRFVFVFLRGKGPVLLAEIGEAAGKADLIGQQVWDDKRGRHRWTNFTALYEAAARVADLPPPDDGWEVATSKTEPSLRSIGGHARWLLRRVGSPF